jgi:hypothetical protein
MNRRLFAHQFLADKPRRGRVSGLDFITALSDSLHQEASIRDWQDIGGSHAACLKGSTAPHGLKEISGGKSGWPSGQDHPTY